MNCKLVEYCSTVKDPVSIYMSGVELEAKSVDYTPGENNTVGSLMAIGPGWIRAS